jgi:hypothetical protein
LLRAVNGLALVATIVVEGWSHAHQRLLENVATIVDVILYIGAWDWWRWQYQSPSVM